MPTRDHSAAPTRKATPQLGARPMLSDDGECTSTAGHAQPAPRSLPLPNNIAGTLQDAPPAFLRSLFHFLLHLVSPALTSLVPGAPRNASNPTPP
jgi:hypothetical protein